MAGYTGPGLRGEGFLEGEAEWDEAISDTSSCSGLELGLRFSFKNFWNLGE